MSATLLSIALQLVRTWVGIYTLGLPRTHRHQRIELIQADLSDQLADMTQAGASQAQLALSLITRSLRGLPDDVTWRLFEARRLPGENSAITLDRRPIMAPRTPGAAFFAIATGLTWAAALVLAVEPVAHSLAYAGGLVAAIALTAWALEARGTPDDETTASVWPLLLAVGIVAIAGGVVFDGGRSGLLLVTPLALGMSTAFGRVLLDSKREFADAVAVQPLPYSELARHAAEGDAIAIESTPQRGVTRRAVLRGSFVLGAASVLATTGGIVVDFLWQRNVAGFGGIVTAGKTSDFPPGSKTIVRTGKFWLVNLTAAQGGPGYLALWQKCPHLGCVVPWDESFSHIDPDTGRPKEGWFRCPCHQSTYNDAGVRVFGPAPRSMDRMALRVTEDGLIEVDTSDISKGADDNATFAIRP